MVSAPPPAVPRRRRLLRAVVWLAVATAVPPLLANGWILWSTRHRLHRAAAAPSRHAAIVLGASVHRDGRPSPILADRLGTAARLHELGKVDLVLVSGDRDLDRDYDEVGPMRQHLLDHGVPPQAIATDPHGYRTLDSVWRARRVFGITSALVVTNAFHLPRAVWLARREGIDCEGVIAPESVDYSLRTRLYNQLREASARTMAVLDSLLLDTGPRVEAPGGAVLR